jgi:hypothetical protein
MPDDIRLPERDLPMAEALGQLPLETPDRSAWPALAAHIAANQRRRRPRWPFALAAAAAVAMAALMPSLLSQRAPAVATPFVAAIESSDPMDALMAESAQLEHFISATGNDAMASANSTMLSLAFEDRLQRVDAALSDPGLDDATRQILWQQRVSLLREYAGVQGTRQWLAAQGTPLEGALVSTY